MPRLNLFITSALLIFCFSLTAQTSVISINIRYDNPGDGSNNWHQRKSEMIKLLHHYEPAIFGIQEGLIHQVNYLDSNLVNYNYIGVGRDDGKESGEFSAIFYDTTKFQIEKTATFWLSDTPDKISVGWDASMERICTFGLFTEKKSGKQLWVFNAHFDHIGLLARANSALLILNKIKELNPENSPVILMGDLNTIPEDRPIQALLQGLEDAKAISGKPFYGPVGTFNGFKDIVMDKRIDYIFTKGLKVLSYEHIDDRRTNNLFISDHLPVKAELLFPIDN